MVDICVPDLWHKIIRSVLYEIKIPPIYLGFFGKVNIVKTKNNTIKPKAKFSKKNFYREHWSLLDLAEFKTHNHWIFLYASIYVLNFVLKPLCLLSKGMYTMFKLTCPKIPIMIFELCGFIPKAPTFSNRSRKKKLTGGDGNNDNNNNIAAELFDDDEIDQIGIQNEILSSIESSKISTNNEDLQNVPDGKSKNKKTKKIFYKENGDLRDYASFINSESTSYKLVRDYFILKSEKLSFDDNVNLVYNFIEFQRKIRTEWIDTKKWFILRYIYTPPLNYSSITEMSSSKWLDCMFFLPSLSSYSTSFFF